MRTRLAITLSLVVLTAICPPAFGQMFRFDSLEAGQQEIGLLVGYGENHRIPEATKDRFSFDTVKLRFGQFVSPRDEFLLDLSAGEQHSEQYNAAIWGTVAYRHFFLVRGQTAASWDIRFGLMRLKDRSPSLGTKTNFTEQLGVTLQHSIGPAATLDLEYTFSHTSNAGIKLPNLGINASMISLGISLYP